MGGTRCLYMEPNFAICKLITGSTHQDNECNSSSAFVDCFAKWKNIGCKLQLNGRFRFDMNGFSTEEDSRNSGQNQICCLIEGGHPCTKLAGNTSYSKRIQETVQRQRFCLERNNSVNKIYICDYHKNMIQNAGMKHKRRESDDGDGSPDGEKDIPETVARHFRSIPVVEKEVFRYFIYMAKNFKSCFDQKHNLDLLSIMNVIDKLSASFLYFK